MMSAAANYALRLLLVFIFSTAAVTGGSRDGDLQYDDGGATMCPAGCRCTSTAINCEKLRGQVGFNVVPTNLPLNVHRLNLQYNNIHRIQRYDFRGLVQLRVLQLMDNYLETIEEGAFDDLVTLERLRLNRNKLKTLPENLFLKMNKLQRLDLSHNLLTFIGGATLRGTQNLRNLQLNNNQITCITESAFRNFKELNTLMLNKNNISTLPEDVFSTMQKLRNVRISDNNLLCDCRLVGLSNWLRTHAQTAMNTKCAQPPVLKGADLSELQNSDLQCSIDHNARHPSDCTQAEDIVCPVNCYCQEGIVRCDRRALTEIPVNIPKNVVELRLERNAIKMVPSKAFQHFKQLRRLHLEDNMINYIAPDAFVGLENLYSLSLSNNQITELPLRIFKGMTSLQLLALNKNKISCVPFYTFVDQKNLAILSLYDNKIKAMKNGTLTPLAALTQIHLAQNPFICDCNLRWLSLYLQSKPSLESSGARCEAPQRMFSKKIASIQPNKFRCIGSEAQRTKNADTCEIYAECPSKCNCVASKIDCSNLQLTSIPNDLPLYVTHLRITNNNIRVLRADSILKKLKHLKSLDLSSNEIDNIESGTFAALNQLEELNLSKNKLANVDHATLRGLKKLKVLLVRANQITCINNDTFTDLTELRLLSLYENRIRCVMEGSFERLTKLSSLNLQLNPLVCNCHLQWMPNYLRSHVETFKDVGNFVCAAPQLLENTPVVSIQSTYFVCTRDLRLGCHNGVPPCCTNDAVSCDPRAYCPPNCSCDGSTVKCDRIGLTDVPEDVPVDTTHLFLQGNAINHINSTRLARLTQLRVLDLSSNKLRGLKEYAFSNLTRLRTLILSLNNLSCIDSKSFAGLSSLRALILQSNDISSIPYGSFDDLQNINNIGLGQNPFYCDCGIKWMNDFFRQKFIDNGIALCAGPSPMTHKSIYHSKPDNFHCPETPSDTMHSQVVAKCNICGTNPCHNGATCNALSFDKHTCTCAPGFHGELCERRIDACFGSPCNNGATCKPVDLYGRYKCICLPGFTGSRCHINIDDCALHQCVNNATCIDGIDAYVCKCKPGYSGQLCETIINYCVDFNPCQNSAQCLVLPDGGYQCVCRAGWEGRNCGLNINDCLNVQCENGGQCVDEVNSYTCKCRPGYYGKKCEFVNMPGLRQSTSVCMHHECLNGGRCVQRLNQEYQCQCLPGFQGKKCEQLTTVGFHAESYVKLPVNRLYTIGQIDLLIATRQQNGMLMFLGEGHHFFFMNLYMGLIRMSYSVGKPPGAIGYSLTRIDNGTFFNISVRFDQDTVTLNVNGGVTRTRAELITDAEKQLKTDFVNIQTLYLGALPQNMASQLRQNLNIQESFSFGGCIKAAYINGHHVDFKGGVGISRHKLVEGCPTFLAPEDPCLAPDKKTLCQNGGVCRPIPDTPHGFQCVCKRNFSGRNCEIKACKRLVSHQHYVDKATGCRSRRRLKIRRCKGTCPSTSGLCCKPIRFKLRSVKFSCQNGGFKTIPVRMIKRCGCRACGNRSDDTSISEETLRTDEVDNNAHPSSSSEDNMQREAMVRQRRKLQKRKYMQSNYYIGS